MNYRYCYLLASLLLLTPFLSRAQQVRPLGSEPAHAPVGDAGAARRAVVLPLPFFDDFARQPEGRPDAQRWEPTGGALVNNRYPRRPISRNVATLDGLDALGRPRGPIGRVGDADSLTSQPIDLSGLQPSANVYLSFFWQAGTRRGRPEASGTRPVALYVEFKNRNGIWDEVWRLNSPADTTNFRFKALALNQAAYLHGDFQFRIRTSGYLYNARDAWSVDYVRLDRNRSATDSTFRDIATSRALPSALRRYTAMPVNQFNANPASELAMRTATTAVTTANNLDGGPAPTPITWLGLLDVLPDNTTSRFLRGNASLDAGARQYPIAGEASVPAVPLTPAPKQLRQRVVLITNETDPRTLANDTVSRRTDLSDYFAYDDGTAEASLSLAPASTGPPSYYALRFDLNQPDQVRALRLYPVLATAAGRTLTAVIWDADASGRPAAEPKATKTFSVPLTLPAGQPYVEVVFDAPVKVSSVCFAGYGQAPTAQFVEFGYDLNNASPPNYLFSGVQGALAPFNPATNYSPAGALMLRPLMGGGVVTAAPAAEVAAARYLLAPNPTPDGRVRVPGPYRHATVLDALGRVVWEQPAAEAGRPELRLPLAAGLYFVRLLLPDGQVLTQRLSVSGQ